MDNSSSCGMNFSRFTQPGPGCFTPPAPNNCPSPDRFFVAAQPKMTLPSTPPLPANCPPLYLADGRDRLESVSRPRYMSGDGFSPLIAPINYPPNGFGAQGQGYPSPQYKIQPPPGTCLQFPHRSDPTSIGAKLGPEGSMYVKNQDQNNMGYQSCCTCPQAQTYQGYPSQRPCRRNTDGYTIPLRGTKSREIRSSKLINNCSCMKNNGLQDDCKRTSCGGRTCMAAPQATSFPTQYMRYGQQSMMNPGQQSMMNPQTLQQPPCMYANKAYIR